MLLEEENLGKYEIEWIKWVFNIIHSIRPIEDLAVFLAGMFGLTDFNEESINYACNLICEELTYESVGDYLISRRTISVSSRRAFTESFIMLPDVSRQVWIFSL